MKKLLIIGFTWPEPDSSAAGQRIVQLIQVFREAGYAITFCSAARETEYSLDLESLGVARRAIRLNSDTFDNFITELGPDVVLFDRFLTEEQFGWRMAENVPKAIRILDTEDLHSLRQAREKAVKKGNDFTLMTWLEDDITLRELASVYRCDLSLIISSYEMELLQKEIGLNPSLLLHLPFMVDKLPHAPEWPQFKDRRDFLFIGGGKHAPNVDAIQQLKTKIWPQIHNALPKARLFVYGAYLPQQIIQMHRPKEGFFVAGRAGNVKNVMEKARVCLAPLRFGAGIKGKLLEAMRYGTPSVTTVIGAEGMHNDLPWNGAIVENFQDFAERAVELYTDETKWEIAQKAGNSLVHTIYSRDALNKRLFDKVAALEDSLGLHRSQNFMGRMLQYHTLASTKYLGKWIECKNRKEGD